MHEFYTVSKKDISSLSELNLFDSSNDEVYEVNGYFTKNDAKTKIKELFPFGISSHGKQYLHSKYNYVNDVNSNTYISYMDVIEITFELVRQIKFNDKLSRFESIFGWETIEEAIKFKKEKRKPTDKIYKVSTESFFKADMNLLYTATIIGNIIFAEKYWNGEASQNPCWEILMEAPIKIIEEIE